MKTNFENIANAKIKVEYFELTENGMRLQPTTKNEGRKIVETIFTKQGRHTLKTVIYE